MEHVTEPVMKQTRRYSSSTRHPTETASEPSTLQTQEKLNDEKEEETTIVTSHDESDCVSLPSREETLIRSPHTKWQKK